MASCFIYWPSRCMSVTDGHIDGRTSNICRNRQNRILLCRLKTVVHAHVNFQNTVTYQKLQKSQKSYYSHLVVNCQKVYRGGWVAKSDLRKAVLNYEKKLAKETRNNPKAFYRYINSKTKSRCSNGTLETKQGELIEGNRHKAEALNKHFSSVFTREGLGELPHFSQRSCQNQLQDMTFDASEIKDKLLNLKTNKCPGPDEIHPRLLKEMHSVLSVPLQKLFTRLLQLGCPEAWKVGHITPVFKKGNKKDVSNYRPTSLTSVTGKVMESLVRTRLMKHFTDNNFMSHDQHGFLPGRSCSTQLLEVLDIWTRILDNGDNVDVVYRLCKGFWHRSSSQVTYEATELWRWWYIWHWIKDFLENRKQCVVVNGEISSFEQVLSVIPQGSVLGPILFLIYINDMPETVQYMIKLFADDS